MATFVLVHGAWHGAWCWHKVVAALSAAGHRALAIDLPSHGADTTPIADVTLRTYADRIRTAVDAHAEPVVLVGHSMGGIAISQAAEDRADRLHSLVYVTAILPAPGDTISRAPEVPAIQNHVTPSADGSALEISPEGAVEVFYGDCSDEDVALALNRLCPQASNVFGSPLELSTQNFGRIPRYYIACQQDAALTPEVQRAFYERTPCRKVYQLESGHSPFFSHPDDLCRILCEIASAPG